MKASALNRLFQEQGITGQPGQITAATVEHGERNAGARAKLKARSEATEEP